MCEIKILGPDKSRVYPYPVCKKTFCFHGSDIIKVKAILKEWFVPGT